MAISTFDKEINHKLCFVFFVLQNMFSVAMAHYTLQMQQETNNPGMQYKKGLHWHKNIMFTLLSDKSLSLSLNIVKQRANQHGHIW